MPSKKNWIVWGLLGLFQLLLLGADSPEVLQKKLRFLKLMYSDYSFMEGVDSRQAPQTLNKFFTDPIYRKLRGNDLVGFQFDQGFTFIGDALQLVELKTTAETARFAKHFSAALAQTAQELKFKLGGQALCQVAVCLVAVVDRASSESLPGVILELYVKNVKTGKKLFLRLKSGSREGWYEAMRDSWRYVCLILKSSTGNGRDG